MDRPQLIEAVERFKGARVVVVGDLMLDAYLWGQATRISPEAPVMVVNVDKDTFVPGGAANVVNNLVALGAEVSVCGICGTDTEGDKLIEALENEGADTSAIVRVSDRPTTIKTRVVTHNQQVLRIDREVAAPISPEVQAQLLERMKVILRQPSSVVFSDYAKGMFGQGLAQQILGMSANLTFSSVNAKPVNATCFSGTRLFTVNQTEADQLAGNNRDFHDPELINSAGTALREKLAVETLVVTRGGKGMIAFESGTEPTAMPSIAQEVYDVAGAGDTTVSVLALAKATGAPILIASKLAMAAASLAVRKVGVSTVSSDELLEMLA